MRSVLVALTEIKARGRPPGRVGPSWRRGQLRSSSAIFSVRDLGAALAHYADLGFHTFAYEDGDDYGFADRDGTGHHLAAGPDDDPAHASSAYLYVRDAVHATRSGADEARRRTLPAADRLEVRRGPRRRPRRRTDPVGSPMAAP